MRDRSSPRGAGWAFEGTLGLSFEYEQFLAAAPRLVLGYPQTCVTLSVRQPIYSSVLSGAVFDTVQTVLPYSWLDGRMPSQGLPMYNLDLVRQLCKDVTREKDPEKERISCPLRMPVSYCK